MSMSNDCLYVVICSMIGGISGFFAFLPCNMTVLGAVLSGALLCGGYYAALVIIDGTTRREAERQARCIMDAIIQNRHEGEAKQ